MGLPRVTEILKAYSNYEKVPMGILERAAARGTSVHALCAGIAHGNWIPDTMINEEFRGYVESFNKWSKAQVSKFIVIEKRYSNEDLKYSGQVDYVIMGSDDNLYLVDIKTSVKPQKTYPVQMAAYQHLLRCHNIPIKAAMLVYLDKDGEFPEVHLIEDLYEELSVFISALHCWNYFNKGKKDDGKSDETDS